MMTDLNFWMTYSFKPTDCTHMELHPESTLGQSWLRSTLSSEEQTGRRLLDSDLGSRRITQQIHPSSHAVKRKDETSANKAIFSSLQFSCAVYSVSTRFPTPFPMSLWGCDLLECLPSQFHYHCGQVWNSQRGPELGKSDRRLEHDPECMRSLLL